jgi:hypothetical protein
LGQIDPEAVQNYIDKKRIDRVQERMQLKHSLNSKFQKTIKKYHFDKDHQVKEAIKDNFQLRDKLLQKIEGKENENGIEENEEGEQNEESEEKSEEGINDEDGKKVVVMNFEEKKGKNKKNKKGKKKDESDEEKDKDNEEKDKDEEEKKVEDIPDIVIKPKIVEYCKLCHFPLEYCKYTHQQLLKKIEEGEEEKNEEDKKEGEKEGEEKEDDKKKDKKKKKVENKVIIEILNNFLFLKKPINDTILSNPCHLCQELV